MTPNEVVVTELTARGRGGVSVLQVRGAGVLAHVARLLPRPGNLRVGELRVASLSAGDELLDEALVWVESNEVVELHLHGAPPIVDRIVAELTRRATRIPPAASRPTSLEERALERLAHAPSEAAARVLLDQAEGALRLELEAIVAELRACDSPGSGQPGSEERGGGLESPLRSRIERLADAGDRTRFLFEPPLVVLAGPVNAGKSTLFNVLVGRERVVVDAECGTTRDAVRERISLGEYAVDLVDTAGERDLGTDAVAKVEHAGQLLGRSLRGAADLVLWLEPLSRPPGAHDSDRASLTDPGVDGDVPIRAAVPERLRRTLTSRADELSADERSLARTPISSTDPNGMRRVVDEVVHDALALPREPWISSASSPDPVPFEPALSKLLRRIAAGLADSDVDPGDVIRLESEFLR